MTPHNPMNRAQSTLYRDFTKSSNDLQATISVFVGVLDINQDGTSIWNPDFFGKAILDPKFNANKESSQKFILNLCSEMKNNTAFIIEGSTKCWINDFNDYLASRYNQRLPISEQEFEQKLNEWTRTEPKGIMARTMKQAGFINDKLVYLEFEAQSNVNYR